MIPMKPNERMATVVLYSDTATEEWEITIPDDAPSNPLELNEWLADPGNMFKWDYNNLLDSEFGLTVKYETIEVDPQPVIEPVEPPEWWGKIYGVMLNINPKIIENLEKEYKDKLPEEDN